MSKKRTLSVLMLVSLLFLGSFPAVTQSAQRGIAAELADLGFQANKANFAYGALEALGKNEMTRSDMVQYIEIELRLFLLEDDGIGIYADIYTIINLLRMINAQERVHFNREITDYDSVEIQDIMENYVAKKSGESLFNRGMRIANRSEYGFDSEYWRTKSRKYFEISIEKGFSDPESHMAMLECLTREKLINWGDIHHHAESFIAKNTKKKMAEGWVTRVEAISRYMKNPTGEASKSNISKLIEGLSAAEAKGDLRSKNLINAAQSVQHKIRDNEKCSAISGNANLWHYCATGECVNFSNRAALWSLCENNDITGFSSDFAIWVYLSNGDYSGFSRNQEAWDAARNSSENFVDRKRFIIYYLNGYIIK